MMNMSHTTNRPAFISRQVLDGDYFFLDLKTRSPAKLSIACGGLEHCSPTYDLKREGFRYFAVEFVLSGRGEYTVNKQVHPLRAGSVFAYGPGVTHRIRSIDRNGLTKYFVDFHGPSAKRLLQQSPLNEASPLQLGRTRWVEMIFDMMIAAGSEPRHLAEAQCQHLLSLLMMRLASDTQARGYDASSSYETYLLCRAHMQAHHPTLQTVNEVANACHVDPAYLSRLIKRYAHEGAYQYLVRLKMQHAAELLVKEKQSIKSAAASMGYADVALFSKVFKRVHGVGPKGFMESINR
jgi:AraC-like DNA-binding protein